MLARETEKRALGISKLLTGSLNRFALLIVQTNKFESAMTLVAVAHRGADGHGLGRWERNLHRNQRFGRQFTGDGHPDAIPAEVGRAAPELSLLDETERCHSHERVEGKARTAPLLRVAARAVIEHGSR
jgi:hypothetical protein